MPAFEIRNGDAVHVVDAANWMSALGSGLNHFGLSSDDLSRVICDIDAQGRILVRDPQTGTVLNIEERQAQSPAGARVRLSEGVAQPAAPREPSVRVAQASAPVPLSATPDETDEMDAPDPRSSAAFDTLEEQSGPRMEELYAASQAVLEADDAQAAAALALDIVMRFVPAESGAVLLKSRAGDTLIFVAARGPRADQVAGVSIPADAGIAGLAVSSRTSLLVREVRLDPRHFKDVDSQSGYATQALLAVPLRSARGVLGVFELLNPYGVSEFEEWHLDAAQIVGARLSSRLG